MRPSRLLTLAILLGAPLAASATVIFDPVVNSGSYFVIPNGGFQAGMSGWGGFGPGSFVASNDIAINGGVAKSVPSFSFGGSGFAAVQGISISPGTYVLSAYIDASQASVGDNNYLDLNDVPWEPSPTAVSGDSRLQFVYDTFTVPAGVNSATVRMVRDGTVTAGKYTYFDDVAVTPIDSFVAPSSSVPEPASAALLVVGSGMIMTRRRRD